MKKPYVGFGRRSPATLSLSALAGISLGMISGCSKLESGAHAEPSVRIKLVEAPKAITDNGKTPEAGSSAVSGVPGTFAGRILFNGTPPSPKVMYEKGKAPKEPEVCSKDGAIMDESLVIGADKGIANVFIYLDKPPAGFKATPATETIPFDQKNCTFLTHALICRVGQPIQVLNADGGPHNTKNFPLNNDPINATVGPNNREGATVAYKKPEKSPVGVKCDFHAWMSAYHLPLNHPFGAVTDKDGNFKIENLPPGDYQFKIWHEKVDGGKGGYLESKYKVSVKGDMKPVDILEDASKFGL
jgi:hypothetical protein